MKRTKVIVLGASGQLGHTFRKLCDAYYSDRILLDCRNHTTVDITRPEDIESCYLCDYEGHPIYPDYIINCAAYTNVPWAETDGGQRLAMNINAAGVRNLALFCAKHGIRLIHISTDYVWSGVDTPDEALTTPGELIPKNWYGMTKLLGDTEIQQTRGLDWMILRTAGLYSEDSKTNIVWKFVDAIRKRNHITAISDNAFGITRCHSLVSFILWHIIVPNQFVVGIWNVTDGGLMSTWELVRNIGATMGLAPTDIDSIVTKVSQDEYESTGVVHRPRCIHLDCTDTINTFGWFQNSAEVELAGAVDWMIHH